MLVQGTDKIKSVLELPDVKKQVVKGQTIHVTENEYWKNDVQVALRMGWLKSIKQPKLPEEDDGVIDDNGVEEVRIKCKNVYKRDLSLPGFSSSIPVGQTFWLKESELNIPAIKSSISKGFIRVIGGDTDIPDKVSKVRMSELFEENTELDNPNKLDTNEEVKVMGVIDSENPKPITKSDVPDALGKSIIYNPAGNKVINQLEKVVIASTRGVEVVESIASKKSDEIKFVDKEEEQKRLDSHPVLSKKAAVVDEVELVDLNREQNERLHAHPILGKKENGSTAE